MNLWEEKCRQEEIIWRQKSQVLWLREGEKNTKFFHRSIIAYRNSNRIFEIKDDRGNTYKGHQDIKQVLVQHFKKIVKEPQVDRMDYFERIVKQIPALITEEDNKNLNNLVYMEEAAKEVTKMLNDKALSLDGFTIDFFKSCSEIVKTNIYEVVTYSQNYTTILKALNSPFYHPYTKGI